VIFSLTSIVPALVVQYTYKASGIMADLELSRWVVKIEDVTPVKLSQMLDELVREAEDYRDHLELVIPPYRERAREAVELTKRAYETFITGQGTGSVNG